jgi:hypothetical protein
VLISDPSNLKEALRLAYAEIERLQASLRENADRKSLCEQYLATYDTSLCADYWKTGDDHPNTIETGRTIMPAMLQNWKDQMRRYRSVSIPADWFPVVLDIIERPHRGCFCPHCNPSE